MERVLEQLTISAKIRYVGSYEELDIRVCLENKLNTMVEDEFGLPKPLSISLVIPTKIDATKETRDVEMTAMRNTLSECGRLVDLGYVDEIIVVDGSLNEKNEPDFEVLEKVVDTAYDTLDLFKRQVELINENKAQALMAKRGFTDFIVKTVHQFDPNIFHALNKLGVSKISSLPRIPTGKGAALWLSTPLTAGDAVCFVDSDIINFKKEFVIALCDPVIRTMADTRLPIKLVKAFYRRLTVSFEPLGRKYFFGGRVTRLFAIPLFTVLSKEYPNIFGGIDSLDYPLSGEFAVRRDLLERITFPIDYSIEFSILRQTIKLAGVNQIAQVDLNFFHHIGQSVENLGKMIPQITNHIIKILAEEGVKVTESVRSRILTEYDNEVKTLLPKYEALFDEKSQSLFQEIKEKLTYSKDVDLNFSQEFRKILDNTLAKDLQDNQSILPSWTESGERTNYFVVSTILRRRGNQSTFSRLKNSGLFYGL